jgi:hypothetical protein
MQNCRPGRGVTVRLKPIFPLAGPTSAERRSLSRWRQLGGSVTAALRSSWGRPGTGRSGRSGYSFSGGWQPLRALRGWRVFTLPGWAGPMRAPTRSSRPAAETGFSVRLACQPGKRSHSPVDQRVHWLHGPIQGSSTVVTPTVQDCDCAAPDRFGCVAAGF